MKRLLAVTVLVKAMLSSSIVYADPPPPPEGVEVSVKIANSLKAGHALPVQVELANGSEVAISSIRKSTEPFAVYVILVDNVGRNVPLTRYGRRSAQLPIHSGDFTHRAGGSTRTSLLQPGDSADLSIDNLALYYDVTLPGEYVLKVEAPIGLGDRIPA